MFTLAYGAIAFIILGIMVLIFAVMAVIYIVLFGAETVGLLSNRSAERREMKVMAARTGLTLKDIAKIKEWFSYSIRYKDFKVWYDWNRANKEGKNYAIVMRNESGFDFEEFSCRVTPYSLFPEEDLEPVTCIARNWKNGKKGLLWFYCPAEQVSSVSRDVEDISFLPMLNKEDNQREDDDSETGND